MSHRKMTHFLMQNGGCYFRQRTESKKISCSYGDNVKFKPYDTSLGSSFFAKKLD